MRKTRLAALAAATLAVLATATTATTAAAGTTELKPGQLERGDDVRIPHVEGTTLVDGDVRITFKAAHLRLLGTAGDDYIVTASNSDYSRHRTLRVEADGDRTLLVRGLAPWSTMLSSTGSRLAHMDAGSRSSTLTVYSTATGKQLRTKTFPFAWIGIFDFEGSRLALSTFTSAATRTWIYDVKDGFKRVIVEKAAQLVDLGTDRVAFYTKDPYAGGCVKLAKASDATQVIWKSCHERIAALSPTAKRMATIHILSDGIGPNEVIVRTGQGGRLATYTAEWFGAIDWESDYALLLETNGTKKAATVRCTLAGCERASDLRPVPTF